MREMFLARAFCLPSHFHQYAPRLVLGVAVPDLKTTFLLNRYEELATRDGSRFHPELRQPA